MNKKQRPPKVDSRSAITACVCTYDRYDVLEKCLRALARQTLDPSQYRILVVDNSPDHDKAAQVAKQYADIPNLHYHIELIPGLSNARNVGARTCGTDFIAYIDDDAIPDTAWLERIVAAFEQFGEQAGIVGGRVNPIWEIERPQWLHDGLLGYVSVVNWGGATRIATEREWFAGTNIAFRTSALAEAGMFNVNLGRIGGGGSLLSNEETDVSDKIKKLGFVGVYEPDAIVDHLVEKRRIKQEWFRKRIVWQAISDYLMDPSKAAENARNGWDWALTLFSTFPPRQRNIRALYAKCDSSALFDHQINALYTVTGGLLAGFEGME